MNAAHNNGWDWSRIWRIARLPLTILGILSAVSLLVLVIVRYGYAAPWTGFGETAINSPDQFQPKKLLWDWLELLIIPIFLLLAGWIYSEWQKRSEYRLAKEKEHSDALQAYFDSMKDLIIDGKLTDTQDDPDHPVRALAISKTITTLQIIDDHRKKAVFNFLSHAGLLTLNQPVILLDDLELEHANLRNIKLTFVDLRSISLQSADLTGAAINNCNFALAGLQGVKARNSTFKDTDLENAVLSEANFQNANLYASRLVGAHLDKGKFKNAVLSRALLNGAELHEADFSEAQLDFCDFSNIDESEEGKTKIRSTKFNRAHLQGTLFSGVDFRQGVDFEDAVLDHANFRGSNITSEQIKAARSKRGVIMPNGSLYQEEA